MSKLQAVEALTAEEAAGLLALAVSTGLAVLQETMESSGWWA